MGKRQPVERPVISIHSTWKVSRTSSAVITSSVAPFGHNASLTHGYDSIGVTRGMDHIVDHCNPGAIEVSNQIQDGQLVRGVEVSSRLVKQGNWCFLGQRHGGEDALALTDGKV